MPFNALRGLIQDWYNCLDIANDDVTLPLSNGSNSRKTAQALGEGAMVIITRK